jgi:hypothetical protein
LDKQRGGNVAEKVAGEIFAGGVVTHFSTFVGCRLGFPTR